MKKLIVIAVFAILLTGCGVGTYSIQSGVEDAAYISFTDDIIAYIEKADLKSCFDNPVPEYVKLLGKKDKETTDMCEDISAYLNELKKAKESA